MKVRGFLFAILLLIGSTAYAGIFPPQYAHPLAEIDLQPHRDVLFKGRVITLGGTIEDQQNYGGDCSDSYADRLAGMDIWAHYALQSVLETEYTRGFATADQVQQIWAELLPRNPVITGPGLVTVIAHNNARPMPMGAISRESASVRLAGDTDTADALDWAVDFANMFAGATQSLLTVMHDNMCDKDQDVTQLPTEFYESSTLQQYIEGLMLAFDRIDPKHLPPPFGTLQP